MYKNKTYLNFSNVSSSEAAKGEINEVEAEAMAFGNFNTKNHICVLVQGKDEQRFLDLEFHHAPVKFRLVKGNGPVHLVGTHNFGEFFLINLIFVN